MPNAEEPAALLTLTLTPAGGHLRHLGNPHPKPDPNPNQEGTFATFDTDGDGCIGQKELGCVMRTLGTPRKMDRNSLYTGVSALGLGLGTATRCTPGYSALPASPA